MIVTLIVEVDNNFGIKKFKLFSKTETEFQIYNCYLKNNFLIICTITKIIHLVVSPFEVYLMLYN